MTKFTADDRIARNILINQEREAKRTLFALVQRDFFHCTPGEKQSIVDIIGDHATDYIGALEDLV